MNHLRQIPKYFSRNIVRGQNVFGTFHPPTISGSCNIENKDLQKFVHTTSCHAQENNIPKPLRRLKQRSELHTGQDFVDIKYVQTIGGKGGDGQVSLLQLWVNDKAGPDGGDGGNGGHVIFEVTESPTDLRHVNNVIKALNGENGQSKLCFGKSAEHTVVHVPVGTIVRDINGKILADLDEIGMMFIAARGGAGGHGNAFFKSNINKTPKICERGACGENSEYILEVRTMAHVGLIGFPNAGKSTLLRAISRARPKVAAYPFTTLKPHLGMVMYEDYEQIAVADLPGLVTNAHKNEGLGISFLKHAERCAALLYVLDISSNNPWDDFKALQFEISKFNEELIKRPLLLVVNKMDLPSAVENLKALEEKVNLPIIPISAKTGTNLTTLLYKIRKIYDELQISKHDFEDSTM